MKNPKNMHRKKGKSTARKQTTVAAKKTIATVRRRAMTVPNPVLFLKIVIIGLLNTLSKITRDVQSLGKIAQVVKNMVDNFGKPGKRQLKKQSRSFLL